MWQNGASQTPREVANMAKGTLKPVIYGILTVPLGFLALLTVYATARYFLRGAWDPTVLMVHILVTGFFVGSFVLVMRTRKKTTERLPEPDAEELEKV